MISIPEISKGSTNCLVQFYMIDSNDFEKLILDQKTKSLSKGHIGFGKFDDPSFNLGFNVLDLPIVFKGGG